MIVFSEASEQLAPSSSADDIRAATQAARLAGFDIYTIPQDFTLCEKATNALWHVPVQARETTAFWIGYIPTVERYHAIYDAALSKNIRLVNTPEQHRTAQEFDAAYERLRDLTPRSFILTRLDECETAIEHVGLPVFVKGVVQSRKARGWKACVAQNREELRELAGYLFDLEARTRGRVIVRELVNLRHTRTSGEGFPLGREYRVFLLRNRVLECGYYWEGDDELRALSKDEQVRVLDLAQEASGRLAVPFVAIDIGQKEDGNWIVIESGDAQFAGASQIPLLKLWHKLHEAATASE